MSLPQTGSTGSVEQSSLHSHTAVSLGKERHLALYSHLTSPQGSTEYNTVVTCSIGRDVVAYKSAFY